MVEEEMGLFLVVGFLLIIVGFVLKVIFDIVGGLSSMFGGPSGEVPYEMVRASYGIVHEFNNIQENKMYAPVLNYVDGHFIAVNQYNYDDILYLDDYFK